MFKDFKEFAFKGNMIDMAVGIIIGGAFGLVVKSLVNNVIMPIVAGVFKAPDFSAMGVILGEDKYGGDIAKAVEAGVPVIQYGTFINDFLNLLIVAFSLFIMVKYVMGAMKRKEEAQEEVPEEDPGPTQEELLAEIRDLLKK